MIAGLSGSLLSHDALEQALGGMGRGVSIPLPAPGGDRLRMWHASIRSRLGPTAAARTVFDLVAEPLVRALGFEVIPLTGAGGTVDGLLHVGGAPLAALIVTAWGQTPAGVWRHAVHRGLAHGFRWSLCVTGTAVRILDVERTYARRYAEFDLAIALEDERSRRVLCGLLSVAGAASPSTLPVLDAVVSMSEKHRVGVRRALREGVHQALLHFVAAFRAVSRKQARAHLLDESLVVVYRVLFLLFAEARALVPTWHPVYRDGYTVEALCAPLNRAVVPSGLWEALQAIARLAHRGCRAGTLRVPPFNGRLFSPADAPLADAVPLDDRIVAQALLALTTREGEHGRDRISYADLGVEQLGAVYEHLLDYDLAAGTTGATAVLVPSGRRKATGSFYTPRSLTEFVVRRTLAPAVQDKTPEQILALRILDPAMGSGAFLVAACRYLASAYEQALLNEGTLTPGDITEDDRAAFRRAVAQRCLFGVDINPMSVQLGRLSLWLATLSGDKPLTFLDHHLRAGNSLVGASIDEILRQPAPGRGPARARDLPLFDDEALEAALRAAVGTRLAIAHTPDDTIEQVRGKERALAALTRPGGALDRWRLAADTWCAAWFDRPDRAPGTGTFRALLDHVLHGGSALPAHLAEPLLTSAASIASTERFFHWTLEFAEVFHDERGGRCADGGFDAIVGNPPWEMLRHEGARTGTRELRAFVRGSAVYRLQGHGHANLYQLFVERSLQLVRPGGRVGLVLPSGFGTDQSSARLRRTIFERTAIDTYTTLDNREGIFPIHRSVKFLLLTFTNAGATASLFARPGVRSPELLDRIPDTGVGPSAGTITLKMELIERVAGESLAVPEIRTEVDLEIVSHITFEVPAAGDPDGWGIRFGRELNATDDRPHFAESASGLPVIEGKQIRAFGVDTDASRYRIAPGVARRLLDGERTFRRARLGYREVASSTNRTTLIAAIVPAGVVTTHTVFCLKDSLDDETQHFLCGVFNSYVANYLVRMRVTTHVTAGIIARLPVPKPPSASAHFREIARLSQSLSRTYEPQTYAQLNAMVARLYGLTHARFAHVLDTFPLVPAADRRAALQMFFAERV
ncbi:MAG: Eco57I restriction-modification methylase domain-containing protein [Vicinamibacterales bacterium]